MQTKANGERQIELYLKRSGLDLGTVLLDPATSLSKHYHAVGLPATLLIRADGGLDGAHLGEISKETLLEAISALKKKEQD
ncbi:TlpA family protein disulfide reductase [Agrobacterium sp. P15N1-A]|uniref:TlpA family protein disulfide reductase n=1 Tax=Agrobacterium sp. P15N1-A TaxID=3342820 RepID=UPI0037CDABDA